MNARIVARWISRAYAPGLVGVAVWGATSSILWGVAAGAAVLLVLARVRSTAAWMAFTDRLDTKGSMSIWTKLLLFGGIASYAGLAGLLLAWIWPVSSVVLALVWTLLLAASVDIHAELGRRRGERAFAAGQSVTLSDHPHAAFNLLPFRHVTRLHLHRVFRTACFGLGSYLLAGMMLVALAGDPAALDGGAVYMGVLALGLLFVLQAGPYMFFFALFRILKPNGMLVPPLAGMPCRRKRYSVRCTCENGCRLQGELPEEPA